MSALAEACKRLPFSNGTERRAWEAVWCDYCVHDHDVSHHDGGGPGCELLSMLDFGGPMEGEWPEVWLPEPAGSFSLPSRMVCGQFEPCAEGDCTGDPHAERRSAITAEVRDYWKQASQ
jgi:hypothetical protein